MAGEWKKAEANGRTYYYHTETKKTRWDKPEGFEDTSEPAVQHDPAAVDRAWKEARDPSGKPYYYNAITKATSWSKPPGFSSSQPEGAPAFVAGGAQLNADDGFRQRDRRREERDHGPPQRPGFDGGRGGGSMSSAREQRQEHAGFRGPMPVKSDEPDYATQEEAEEAFFNLLRKHNISPESTWEDALRLVVREKDFRALKDPKERRQAFEKYGVEVRAQEKGKEKERRERLKEDFRQMLATHDDIKHYTRWKTARSIIEREAVYKSVDDDDLRRHMYADYIAELKRKKAEDEIVNHKNAMQDLGALLEVLVVGANEKWEDTRDNILNNEHFTKDEKFRVLSDLDLLTAFERRVEELSRVANAAKQGRKQTKFRNERQTRDAYKELLSELRSTGRLRATTKWKDFRPLIAEDDRYLNSIGNPGSSSLDFFWDMVQTEEQSLRSLRNDALDVLEDQRYEMTVETTLPEFAKVMRADPRTARFNEMEMNDVYEKMMEKVRKRAEDERLYNERHQRKALDALRSVIRHLEPPVRLGDSYEDVASRLQEYEEYRTLNGDDARSAFDKHMRKLKEREEETGRERIRRDRERDHRNGSRHERDRDRDRRHRIRTPEVDAYEADRRKAQADRERQYRKASFGLSPPPASRERRDDREPRPRRSDRQDAMSVYDHERREREMERERSYISRADPRDKGRTLDYGDEDVVGSRPGSVRKRRESEGSAGARRESKRSRRTRTPEIPVEPVVKEDSPALQSGSEEGEIEEV